MVCPRCGTQLINGSRICMACGQNVAFLTNSNPASTKPASPTPTPVRPAAPTPTPVRPAAPTPTPVRPAAATPTPAQPAYNNTTPVRPAAATPTPAQPAYNNTAPVRPAAATPVQPSYNNQAPVRPAAATPVQPSYNNQAPVRPAAPSPTPTPAPAPVPAAAPETPVQSAVDSMVKNARTKEEIEELARIKTGYPDKFIKKYNAYWGALASKLNDGESYEFVFGAVANLDGDDDRIAGCGITKDRIIVTTTQGTVSYTYDKTKSVTSTKSLIGAMIIIEIPRSKVKLSVDKSFLDNILKAVDTAIKKYRI